MAEKDPWVPTSREEWEETFAGGVRRALAAEREEEAKSKKSPPEPDPNDKKDPAPKRSLRDILLGA